MASDSEIVSKFWKGLKADRTFMLGLNGEYGGDPQPMTALIEDRDDDALNQGPTWVFSASDVDLVKAIGSGGTAALGQFTAKGHGLFASFRGTLSISQDRAVIERLWNPFIAAWFDGIDDPKLRLLRFDVEHVHVWLNENSVFAGVKMMLGRDPKEEYADKTADVTLA